MRSRAAIATPGRERRAETPFASGFRSLALLLGAVLALAAAACSNGTSPPADTSTPPPDSPVANTPSVASSPAVSPTPRPLPGVQFPPDQSQTLADLIARTAELRGLEPKGDIEKRLIGRQEAADYLVSTIDEEDRERLNTKQELYRVLGLIPDDADLLELQISLLRALVLGFYDPDVKALFILQDLGLTSIVTRLTVVHEVVHALQDQYFDLNAVEERIRDDWDMSTAFIDLVEGDARGVETEFASAAAANNARIACDDGSFNVSTNSNIPVVIQRELQAPYSDGRCFIFNVLPSIPEGVDAIFRNLPRSTEQVLHPQKYLQSEEPEQVTLEPLAEKLGAGWKQAASSTFGEFGLQNLLLLGVTDRTTVKSGADGWGGDRWALYSREDGAGLVVLATAWDSQAEARQFWEVLLRSLDSRSGGRLRPDTALNFVTWEQGGRTLRARLSGDRVTIVMSTDAAAAEAAAQALGLG